MTERDDGFEGLVRRLARVDEIGMRAGLLCEQLEVLPLERGVTLVEEAHRGAALGDPDGQSVFLALGWALFEPRLATRRIELGVEARHQTRHHLADFLIPDAREDVEDNPRRVPEFGRGRPLTLGERKSLARTHDRDLIQRVVRDPHPDVVKVLLDNPSLTEEEVVRICAIRPNDPDVLRAVHRHRRWVVRYRPRHAIVRNPSCPLDVALLLAPMLRPADLREASTASGLAPALRLACRAHFTLRQNASDPPSR